MKLRCGWSEISTHDLNLGEKSSTRKGAIKRGRKRGVGGFRPRGPTELNLQHGITVGFIFCVAKYIKNKEQDLDVKTLEQLTDSPKSHIAL